RDQVSPEGEEVVVGEPEPPVLAMGSPARAGHDDDVPRVDRPLDEQLRTALEGGILDLLVELGLAARAAQSMDVPDDILGEAAEDRLVVAAPEAVEVAVDESFAGVHDVLPLLSRSSSPITVARRSRMPARPVRACSVRRSSGSL